MKRLTKLSVTAMTLALYQLPSSEYMLAQRSPTLKKTGVMTSLDSDSISFSFSARLSYTGSSNDSCAQKEPSRDRDVVTKASSSAPFVSISL